MCLIAVGWRASPRFPLVLAANRDEFHDRPSAPANWWPGPTRVLGGVDLRAGGSWLAVDAGGRLAAVTNRRDMQHTPLNPRSRGNLVRDFLAQNKDTAAFLDELMGGAATYAPFNLLVADTGRLAYYGSGDSGWRDLKPGIYGVSNAPLDTAWPKVEKLKHALNEAIQSADPTAALFQALADNTPADDALLPDTGVGIDVERRLSAPFIRSPDYGTRCSTVVVHNAHGAVRFAERRFDAAGTHVGGSEFSFELV